MSRLILLITVLCLIGSGCEIDPENVNSVTTEDDVIIVYDDPVIPDSDSDTGTNDDTRSAYQIFNVYISSTFTNLTETPDSLYIDIQKIEIENLDTDTWETCYTGSKVIDLLNYNNSEICIFPDKPYTYGEYGQIRLHLNNNNKIIFNSTEYELVLKHGSNKQGLKFAGGFVIEEGYQTVINIDFNIEKYLRKKEYYYEIKPTIKISSTEVLF